MSDDLRKWVADKARVEQSIRRRWKRHESNPDRYGWPTARQIAAGLKLSITRVLDVAEDIDHICVNTAVGITGVGYANIEARGDYVLEILD